MLPTTTRRLGLQLLAALCILNAAAAWWAMGKLSEQRTSAVQKAEVTTQNLAGMLDQDIKSSVEKVDLALQRVVDELQHQLRLTGQFDEPRVNLMLATYQQRLKGLISIRVANAEVVVVLGLDMRKDQPLSWADRPFFAILRDQPQLGLFVTKPITGRVSGGPIDLVRAPHQLAGWEFRRAGRSSRSAGALQKPARHHGPRPQRRGGTPECRFRPDRQAAAQPGEGCENRRQSGHPARTGGRHRARPDAAHLEYPPDLQRR